MEIVRPNFPADHAELDLAVGDEAGFEATFDVVTALPPEETTFYVANATSGAESRLQFGG
jgi:hypothetical protein